jgi:ElaB/YqjD/DUF883 family membrane-anchored ribosome-binding protein
MGEEPRATGPQVGATSADENRSPEEIRADIDQTREEMGDTVDALAAKTDVKGQAQQRIADLKGNLDRRRQELTAKARSTTPESAQQSGQQVVAKVRENPAPVALGGAVLAGFLLGRLTGRR